MICLMPGAERGMVVGKLCLYFPNLYRKKGIPQRRNRLKNDVGERSRENVLQRLITLYATFSVAPLPTLLT